MLQVVAMSLLVLALGAAFLLAGYRLFYILLPIWSFVVGFWLGAQASAGIGLLRGPVWVFGCCLPGCGGNLSGLTHGKPRASGRYREAAAGLRYSR